MAKAKLKAALESYKGVDHKLEKQKKLAKEAQKRKRAKRGGKRDDEQEPAQIGEGEDMSEDDKEGGVLIDEEAVGIEVEPAEEAKLKSEIQALLKNKKKLMDVESGDSEDEDEGGEEEEWESDEEDLEGGEADSEDESGEEEKRFDLSHLDDSDTSSSGDDEDANETIKDTPATNGTAKATAEVEEEDEDEEDIPLSDIESLASEDKGDVIPHQRLTINNTAALKKALDRISIPTSNLAFSIHQTITSKTSTANAITDIDDDLSRELAFYAQSLAAVKAARPLLAKEGMPFSRPVDYFAEMVKSDEHMGRVKDKLRDEAAGKKAAAEARRQRDLKKFGKQVQIAKLQERSKEKRETLDKIGMLKRKRAGAAPATETEPDLFDVELDDTPAASSGKKGDRRSSSSRNGHGGGESNPKRRKKDEKYGYGGKKRFSKSSNAESSADMRDFPGKKMRGSFGDKKGGGGGGGGKSRPGKARRSKGRL